MGPRTSRRPERPDGEVRSAELAPGAAEEVELSLPDPEPAVTRIVERSGIDLHANRTLSVSEPVVFRRHRQCVLAEARLCLQRCRGRGSGNRRVERPAAQAHIREPLEVHSPPGGGTRIAVMLPLRR